MLTYPNIANFYAARLSILKFFWLPGVQTLPRTTLLTHTLYECGRTDIWLLAHSFHDSDYQFWAVPIATNPMPQCLYLSATFLPASLRQSDRKWWPVTSRTSQNFPNPALVRVNNRSISWLCDCPRGAFYKTLTTFCLWCFHWPLKIQRLNGINTKCLYRPI